MPLGKGAVTEKVAEDAAKKMMTLEFTPEITARFLKKHDADFCFNFHTTPVFMSKRPEELEVLHQNLATSYSGQIDFESDSSGRAYDVELPSYDLPLQPSLHEKRSEQLELVREKFQELLRKSSTDHPAYAHLEPGRHLMRSLVSLPSDDASPNLDYLLKHHYVSILGGKTRGERIKWLREFIEKYKHPSISRKIADFIHDKAASVKRGK